MERQARDIANWQRDGHCRGYVWDQAAADRTVEFIERFCRHHKGEWAGRYLLLNVWQKDHIIKPLFGWKRASDGTRRYRIAYVEIPRKNGKSTKGAGVGLYLTAGDLEPGAEVYSSATKKDQAKIVHDTAKAMVKASPELRQYLKVLRNNIYCQVLGSKFEPVGADSDTLDGLNPHGNIVDELHAHRDRHVLDVLITGTGARRQPLTFIITTAGVYDPESIGWEIHDLAIKVLEGAIEDDTFFAFIAAADEGDDWRKPETWYKANPNLGVSLKEDYIRAECERAKSSPSYLNTFLRYHLNIWTQQRTRWISLEAWNACDATPITLEEFRGRDVYLGLDLSTKLDLTALALEATRPDGLVDYFWRFYVPEELVLERTQKRLLPDYGAWVRDGYVTSTPGSVIDYEFIRSDILGISKVANIREIAFDPWNAQQLATQLAGDGFQMVEMRQGFRTLSEPSKAFEALVVSRRVRHGGNPVMRWMISNVTVRQDANGNIAPDKSSAAGKIDGVVSAIMARGRSIVQPGPVVSVYETRGVRTV
jgi:phage terminase large subunit-like protein